MNLIRNGPTPAPAAGAVHRYRRGFAYGPAGVTHYGLEDIGVMRIQPGLTTVIPADKARPGRPCLRPGTAPNRFIIVSEKAIRRISPTWTASSLWAVELGQKRPRSSFLFAWALLRKT